MVGWKDQEGLEKRWGDLEGVSEINRKWPENNGNNDLELELVTFNDWKCNSVRKVVGRLGGRSYVECEKLIFLCINQIVS